MRYYIIYCLFCTIMYTSKSTPEVFRVKDTLNALNFPDPSSPTRDSSSKPYNSRVLLQYAYPQPYQQRPQNRQNGVMLPRRRQTGNYNYPQRVWNSQWKFGAQSYHPMLRKRWNLFRTSSQSPLNSTLNVSTSSSERNNGIPEVPQVNLTSNSDQSLNSSDFPTELPPFTPMHNEYSIQSREVPMWQVPQELEQEPMDLYQNYDPDSMNSLNSLDYNNQNFHQNADSGNFRIAGNGQRPIALKRSNPNIDDGLSDLVSFRAHLHHNVRDIGRTFLQKEVKKEVSSEALDLDASNLNSDPVWNPLINSLSMGDPIDDTNFQGLGSDSYQQPLSPMQGQYQDYSPQNVKMYEKEAFYQPENDGGGSQGYGPFQGHPGEPKSAFAANPTNFYSPGNNWNSNFNLESQNFEENDNFDGNDLSDDLDRGTRDNPEVPGHLGYLDKYSRAIDDFNQNWEVNNVVDESSSASSLETLSSGSLNETSKPPQDQERVNNTSLAIVIEPLIGQLQKLLSSIEQVNEKLMKDQNPPPDLNPVDTFRRKRGVDDDLGPEDEFYDDLDDEEDEETREERSDEDENEDCSEGTAKRCSENKDRGAKSSKIKKSEIPMNSSQLYETKSPQKKSNNSFVSFFQKTFGVRQPQGTTLPSKPTWNSGSANRDETTVVTAYEEHNPDFGDGNEKTTLIDSDVTLQIQTTLRSETTLNQGQTTLPIVQTTLKPPENPTTLPKSPETTVRPQQNGFKVLHQKMTEKTNYTRPLELAQGARSQIDTTVSSAADIETLKVAIEPIPNDLSRNFLRTNSKDLLLRLIPQEMIQNITENGIIVRVPGENSGEKNSEPRIVTNDLKSSSDKEGNVNVMRLEDSPNKSLWLFEGKGHLEPPELNSNNKKSVQISKQKLENQNFKGNDALVAVGNDEDDESDTKLTIRLRLPSRSRSVSQNHQSIVKKSVDDSSNQEKIVKKRSESEQEPEEEAYDDVEEEDVQKRSLDGIQNEYSEEQDGEFDDYDDQESGKYEKKRSEKAELSAARPISPKIVLRLRLPDGSEPTSDDLRRFSENQKKKRQKVQKKGVRVGRSLKWIVEESNEDGDDEENSGRFARAFDIVDLPEADSELETSSATSAETAAEEMTAYNRLMGFVSNSEGGEATTSEGHSHVTSSESNTVQIVQDQGILSSSEATVETTANVGTSSELHKFSEENQSTSINTENSSVSQKDELTLQEVKATSETSTSAINERSSEINTELSTVLSNQTTWEADVWSKLNFESLHTTNEQKMVTEVKGTTDVKEASSTSTQSSLETTEILNSPEEKFESTLETSSTSISSSKPSETSVDISTFISTTSETTESSSSTSQSSSMTLEILSTSLLSSESSEIATETSSPIFTTTKILETSASTTSEMSSTSISTSKFPVTLIETSEEQHSSSEMSFQMSSEPTSTSEISEKSTAEWSTSELTEKVDETSHSGVTTTQMFIFSSEKPQGTTTELLESESTSIAEVATSKSTTETSQLPTKENTEQVEFSTAPQTSIYSETFSQVPTSEVTTEIVEKKSENIATNFFITSELPKTTSEGTSTTKLEETLSVSMEASIETSVEKATKETAEKMTGTTEVESSTATSTSELVGETEESSITSSTSEAPIVSTILTTISEISSTMEATEIESTSTSPPRTTIMETISTSLSIPTSTEKISTLVFIPTSAAKTSTSLLIPTSTEKLKSSSSSSEISSEVVSSAITTKSEVLQEISILGVGHEVTEKSSKMTTITSEETSSILPSEVTEATEKTSVTTERSLKPTSTSELVSGTEESSITLSTSEATIPSTTLTTISQLFSTTEVTEIGATSTSPSIPISTEQIAEKSESSSSSSLETSSEVVSSTSTTQSEITSQGSLSLSSEVTETTETTSATTEKSSEPTSTSELITETEESSITSLTSEATISSTILTTISELFSTTEVTEIEATSTSLSTPTSTEQTTEKSESSSSSSLETSSEVVSSTITTEPDITSEGSSNLSSEITELTEKTSAITETSSETTSTSELVSETEESLFTSSTSEATIFSAILTTISPLLLSTGKSEIEATSTSLSVPTFTEKTTEISENGSTSSSETSSEIVSSVIITESSENTQKASEFEPKVTEKSSEMTAVTSEGTSSILSSEIIESTEENRSTSKTTSKSTSTSEKTSKATEESSMSTPSLEVTEIAEKKTKKLTKTTEISTEAASTSTKEEKTSTKLTSKTSEAEEEKISEETPETTSRKSETKEEKIAEGTSESSSTETLQTSKAKEEKTAEVTIETSSTETSPTSEDEEEKSSEVTLEAVSTTLETSEAEETQVNASKMTSEMTEVEAEEEEEETSTSQLHRTTIQFTKTTLPETTMQFVTVKPSRTSEKITTAEEIVEKSSEVPEVTLLGTITPYPTETTEVTETTTPLKSTSIEVTMTSQFLPSSETTESMPEETSSTFLTSTTFSIPTDLSTTLPTNEVEELTSQSPEISTPSTIFLVSSPGSEEMSTFSTLLKSTYEPTSLETSTTSKKTTSTSIFSTEYLTTGISERPEETTEISSTSTSTSTSTSASTSMPVFSSTVEQTIEKTTMISTSSLQTESTPTSTSYSTTTSTLTSPVFSSTIELSTEKETGISTFQTESIVTSTEVEAAATSSIYAITSTTPFISINIPTDMFSTLTSSAMASQSTSTSSPTSVLLEETFRTEVITPSNEVLTSPTLQETESFEEKEEAAPEEYETEIEVEGEPTEEEEEEGYEYEEHGSGTESLSDYFEYIDEGLTGPWFQSTLSTSTSQGITALQTSPEAPEDRFSETSESSTSLDFMTFPVPYTPLQFPSMTSVVSQTSHVPETSAKILETTLESLPSSEIIINLPKSTSVSTENIEITSEVTKGITEVPKTSEVTIELPQTSETTAKTLSSTGITTESTEVNFPEVSESSESTSHIITTSEAASELMKISTGMSTTGEISSAIARMLSESTEFHESTSESSYMLSGSTELPELSLETSTFTSETPQLHESSSQTSSITLESTELPKSTSQTLQVSSESTEFHELTTEASQMASESTEFHEFTSESAQLTSEFTEYYESTPQTTSITLPTMEFRESTSETPGITSESTAFRELTSETSQITSESTHFQGATSESSQSTSESAQSTSEFTETTASPSETLKITGESTEFRELTSETSQSTEFHESSSESIELTSESTQLTPEITEHYESTSETLQFTSESTEFHKSTSESSTFSELSISTSSTPSVSAELHSSIVPTTSEFPELQTVTKESFTTSKTSSQSSETPEFAISFASETSTPFFSWETPESTEQLTSIITEYESSPFEVTSKREEVGPERTTEVWTLGSTEGWTTESFPEFQEERSTIGFGEKAIEAKTTTEFFFDVTLPQILEKSEIAEEEYPEEYSEEVSTSEAHETSVLFESSVESSEAGTTEAFLKTEQMLSSSETTVHTSSSSEEFSTRSKIPTEHLTNEEVEVTSTSFGTEILMSTTFPTEHSLSLTSATSTSTSSSERSTESSSLELLATKFETPLHSSSGTGQTSLLFISSIGTTPPLELTEVVPLTEVTATHSLTSEFQTSPFFLENISTRSEVQSSMPFSIVVPSISSELTSESLGSLITSSPEVPLKEKEMKLKTAEQEQLGRRNKLEQKMKELKDKEDALLHRETELLRKQQDWEREKERRQREKELREEANLRKKLTTTTTEETTTTTTEVSTTTIDYVKLQQLEEMKRKQEELSDELEQMEKEITDKEKELEERERQLEEEEKKHEREKEEFEKEWREQQEKELDEKEKELQQKEKELKEKEKELKKDEEGTEKTSERSSSSIKVPSVAVEGDEEQTSTSEMSSTEGAEEKSTEETSLTSTTENEILSVAVEEEGEETSSLISEGSSTTSEELSTSSTTEPEESSVSFQSTHARGEGDEEKDDSKSDFIFDENEDVWKEKPPEDYDREVNEDYEEECETMDNLLPEDYHEVGRKSSRKKNLGESRAGGSEIVTEVVCVPKHHRHHKKPRDSRSRKLLNFRDLHETTPSIDDLRTSSYDFRMFQEAPQIFAEKRSSEAIHKHKIKPIASLNLSDEEWLVNKSTVALHTPIGFTRVYESWSKVPFEPFTFIAEYTKRGFPVRDETFIRKGFKVNRYNERIQPTQVNRLVNDEWEEKTEKHPLNTATSSSDKVEEEERRKREDEDYDDGRPTEYPPEYEENCLLRQHGPWRSEKPDLESEGEKEVEDDHVFIEPGGDVENDEDIVDVEVEDSGEGDAQTDEDKESEFDQDDEEAGDQLNNQENEKIKEKADEEENFPEVQTDQPEIELEDHESSLESSENSEEAEKNEENNEKSEDLDQTENKSEDYESSSISSENSKSSGEDEEFTIKSEEEPKKPETSEDDEDLDKATDHVLDGSDHEKSSKNEGKDIQNDESSEDLTEEIQTSPKTSKPEDKKSNVHKTTPSKPETQKTAVSQRSSSTTSTTSRSTMSTTFDYGEIEYFTDESLNSDSEDYEVEEEEPTEDTWEDYEAQNSDKKKRQDLLRPLQSLLNSKNLLKNKKKELLKREEVLKKKEKKLKRAEDDLKLLKRQRRKRKLKKLGKDVTSWPTEATGRYHLGGNEIWKVGILEDPRSNFKKNKQSFTVNVLRLDYDEAEENHKLKCQEPEKDELIINQGLITSPAEEETSKTIKIDNVGTTKQLQLHFEKNADGNVISKGRVGSRSSKRTTIRRNRPGTEWPTEGTTKFHVGGTRSWDKELTGTPEGGGERRRREGDVNGEDNDSVICYPVIRNGGDEQNGARQVLFNQNFASSNKMKAPEPTESQITRPDPLSDVENTAKSVPEFLKLKLRTIKSVSSQKMKKPSQKSMSLLKKQSANLKRQQSTSSQLVKSPKIAITSSKNGKIIKNGEVHDQMHSEGLKSFPLIIKMNNTEIIKMSNFESLPKEIYILYKCGPPEIVVAVDPQKKQELEKSQENSHANHLQVSLSEDTRQNGDLKPLTSKNLQNDDETEEKKGNCRSSTILKSPEVTSQSSVTNVSREMSKFKTIFPFNYSNDSQVTFPMIQAYIHGDVSGEAKVSKRHSKRKKKKKKKGRRRGHRHRNKNHRHLKRKIFSLNQEINDEKPSKNFSNLSENQKISSKNSKFFLSFLQNENQIHQPFRNFSQNPFNYREKLSKNLKNHLEDSFLMSKNERDAKINNGGFRRSLLFWKNSKKSKKLKNSKKKGKARLKNWKKKLLFGNKSKKAKSKKFFKREAISGEKSKMNEIMNLIDKSNSNLLAKKSKSPRSIFDKVKAVFNNVIGQGNATTPEPRVNINPDKEEENENDGYTEIVHQSATRYEPKGSAINLNQEKHSENLKNSKFHSHHHKKKKIHHEKKGRGHQAAHKHHKDHRKKHNKSHRKKHQKGSKKHKNLKKIEKKSDSNQISTNFFDKSARKLERNSKFNVSSIIPTVKNLVENQNLGSLEKIIVYVDKTENLRKKKRNPVSNSISARKILSKNENKRKNSEKNSDMSQDDLKKGQRSAHYLKQNKSKESKKLKLEKRHKSKNNSEKGHRSRDGLNQSLKSFDNFGEIDLKTLKRSTDLKSIRKSSNDLEQGQKLSNDPEWTLARSKLSPSVFSPEELTFTGENLKEMISDVADRILNSVSGTVLDDLDPHLDVTVIQEVNDSHSSPEQKTKSQFTLDLSDFGQKSTEKRESPKKIEKKNAKWKLDAPPFFRLTPRTSERRMNLKTAAGKRRNLWKNKVKREKFVETVKNQLQSELKRKLNRKRRENLNVEVKNDLEKPLPHHLDDLDEKIRILYSIHHKTSKKNKHFQKNTKTAQNLRKNLKKLRKTEKKSKKAETNRKCSAQLGHYRRVKRNDNLKLDYFESNIFANENDKKSLRALIGQIINLQKNVNKTLMIIKNKLDNSNIFSHNFTEKKTSISQIISPSKTLSALNVKIREKNSKNSENFQKSNKLNNHNKNKNNKKDNKKTNKNAKKTHKNNHKMKNESQKKNKNKNGKKSEKKHSKSKNSEKKSKIKGNAKKEKNNKNNNNNRYGDEQVEKIGNQIEKILKEEGEGKILKKNKRQKINRRKSRTLKGISEDFNSLKIGRHLCSKNSQKSNKKLSKNSKNAKSSKFSGKNHHKNSKNSKNTKISKNLKKSPRNLKKTKNSPGKSKKSIKTSKSQQKNGKSTDKKITNWTNVENVNSTFYPNNLKNCNSCLCDLEIVLNDLQKMLLTKNDLLDRILTYACQKFTNFGDELTLTSSGVLGDVLPRSRRQIAEAKGLKYIRPGELENLLSDEETRGYEHEILSFPGSDLNIPCNHEGEEITWIMSISRPNYTWTRIDNLPISGIIRKNGNLELYDVDAKDAGNYSCIVTYIDPDNEELVENIYQHSIKIVTLPRYSLRGGNRYRIEICEETILDILSAYLPPKLNDILCKNAICDVFIFAPHCHSHQVSLRILVVPTNPAKLFPISSSQCGLRCRKAIQDKMAILLSQNLRIVLRKTIVFRLPNRPEDRLVPIESKLSNFPRFPGQNGPRGRRAYRKKHSGDADGEVGLLVGCPAGYGLENNHCGPCPAHHHSQDLSARCKRCSLGSYQPSIGSRICRTCTNPFVEGCYDMLWTTSSILIVIFASLFAIILVAMIILWSICCVKRRKNSTNEIEMTLKQPLIAPIDNATEDSEEEIVWQKPRKKKKKLVKRFFKAKEEQPLVYGINFLPNKQKKRENKVKTIPVCCIDSYRSHGGHCPECKKKNHSRPPVPFPDFER